VTCSFFATANKILSQSDICEGGGEVPVNCERSLKFGNALRRAIGVHLDDPQAQVRQGVLRRDRQRLDRERFGGSGAPASRPSRWSANASMDARGGEAYLTLDIE
jgi:hypothetical protein